MASYGTIAELKTRINKTTTGDDTVLTALIAAASLAIDNYTNRPDGYEALAVATARIYVGSGYGWQRIDECTSVNLVAVKDALNSTTYTSWAATDWTAFSGDPRSPDFNSTPYDHIMTTTGGDYSIFTCGQLGGREADWFDNLTGGVPFYHAYNPRAARGVPTVQITAKWGYATTVPTPIKEATLMQAARWYKRFQSAFADVLANAEFGTLLYQQELDPDIKNILVGGRYMRVAVGHK